VTDLFDGLDNAEKLGEYLSSSVDEFHGLQSASKFSDGQSNPTFLLQAESGQFVLRRQPAGVLLPSAHAVDREFRVLQALSETAVPVPKVLHLCEDREVLGSMFFIMTYVPGKIFWNSALPELKAGQRSQIYDAMNEVLATLHDIDVTSVGLADFGKPGNYFKRQVSRWSRQYRDSETESIPAMDRLIDWLPENTPEDDGSVGLIHGDYRIDNMIFDNETNEVLALLDWELSTLGHPLADLAYQCMQWRMPADAPIPGLGGIDRNALGIPTEQEYVERYCRLRNIDGIKHWEFYLVFSFFRLAAILQGVMKRAIEGNASNQRALDYGGFAPALAGMAVDVLESESK